MAPGSGGGEEDAKHVLDEFGQQVQGIVHTEALKYNNELHGFLSKVVFSDRSIVTNHDPCKLNYEFDTNVTSGKSHPCYGRQGVRFSDTNGAECYRTRIKGSKDNTIGACAPFRKLHMCDRNLEEIYPEKIATAHNLLVDVLLAAKHEGEMITKNLKEYDATNYASRICTELARSFADIGDIIRGKDLFLGHQQRKKYLEARLEAMFDNIKKNNEDKLGHLSIEEVREYWWDANRLEVWKAITCHAGQSAQYFRHTCGTGKHRTATNHDCQCANTDVPTYFDYVPQYLRWFEEWAEDFCRKKKKKLPNVKTNCRGPNGTEKYCSGNAHDCTETIYRIGKFVMGNGCTKCSVWCRLYEKWIDNQKQEFIKQKKKYANELSGNNRQKISTPSNKDYKEYEEHFYEIFKTKYKDVDAFLKLLNKENECKGISEVKEEIDFTKNVEDDKNKNDEGTFYHSEYCKPCPDCGVKLQGGTYKKREQYDPECSKESTYNPPGHINKTNIKVLFSGEERGDITEKLKDFCETKGITYPEDEEWQCYYESANNNMCKMTNAVANDKNHAKIMSFNEFFNFWVGHVLNDSIDWRTQLTKCLSENKLKKCEKGCKRNCECFKKWIDKKEKEWIKVKQQFNEQKDLPCGLSHYNLLETTLEDDFLDDITKAYGDAEAIQGIKNMLAKKKKQEEDDNVAQKETIIDILLKHEKEEADECIKTHEDDEKCRDDQDSEDEEDETPPERDNPCAKPNHDNTKHRAIAHNVAYHIQKDAHAEASKRSLSLLKADALEGKYLGSGKEHKLKNICSITEDHSNATYNVSKGPCGGKDNKEEMFNIKEGWKNGEFVNKTHTDTYMPPRRQHFCTSNLEHLNRNSKGLTGANASDSLLGDVLLSAKSEAKFIIGKYKKNPDYNDDATICRALRYSFADLGDIIKGTDLWDEDNGEKTTQQKLEEIFDNMYNKNPDIKEKYNKIEHQKHLHLREDWWEANRHQVWRAMQCIYSGGKCSGMPVDDYIPQRLRWMTEWAEWYCKMQKEAYNELKGKCSTCTRGTCTGDSGDKNCDQCKAACEAYRDKIKKWNEQWNAISAKYIFLYLQAQTDARNVRRSVSTGYEKDQHFLKFFKEIRKENYGKKTYETAEGYVHQEVPHMECQVQKQFCKKKHGVTQPTGEDNTDKEYTFKQPPAAYESACGCEGRNKPVSEEKDACDTVKELLNGKENDENIDSCKKKKDKLWNCSDSSFDEHNRGACMPPRRISLCLHYLEHELKGEKTKKDLKEAFIKTAAAETFLLWKKYKEDKEKVSGATTELDAQLEDGKIPEDFKRQMFYTFGDYRDLCLDTDISASNEPVKTVKDNIKNVFNTNNGLVKGNDKEKREKFWKDHKDAIWKGMVCALEKASGDNVKLTNNPSYKYNNVKFSGSNPPTLETFAQTPQFLRWFIEWGDDFCKKRKEQVEKLRSECDGYECNISAEDTKTKCEKACKAYQAFIEQWKTQYEKQNSKFMTDKHKYNDDPDLDGATYAYEYLSKKLKKIFHNGSTTEKCDYTCMENASTQTQTSASNNQQENTSTQKDLPEAFDYPPKEIGDRCTCPKLPEPKYCVDKTAYDIRKESGKNSDSNLKGNGNKYNGNCNEVTKDKYQEQNGGKCKFKEVSWSSIGLTNNECESIGKERFKIEEVWDCNGKTLDGNNKLCIPPRRKYMCLKKLQDMSVKEIRDSKTLLKKIQEAAKSEGDDIIRNLLPKYPCNEDVICKAMKYSFADLGDIIRGRDIYKGDNKKIEDNLKKVFTNIYNNNKEKLSNYNDNGDNNYTKLREAWWDANRKAIWNAMTCSAPEQAKIYITETGGYISPLTWTKNKCGHNDDPPDYDYIPQPFRWLSEWSETYCLAQKDLLETMKNCKNCKKKTNNGPCEQDIHGACVNCKKKCEKYKKFVENWKKQFEIQDKAYKEIYTEATRNGGNSKGIDENTKNFVKKLQEKCQKDEKNSVDTADKYLESGSVCRRFKFGNNDPSDLNYAFHTEPPSHKEYCECAEEFDPLDECPVDNNVCKKYGIGSCPKKKFNNELQGWTNLFVRRNTKKHEDVIVPYRRIHLCLRNLTRNLSRIKNEKEFKEQILISSASEAKLLSEQYSTARDKAFEAIKYSFADYADIVKGTDMLDNINNLHAKLNEIFGKNDPRNVSDNRKNWWEKNKEKIWNVMMCHYNGSDKKKDRCPSHDDIDKKDQFLRWFQEWTENFCNKRNELYENMVTTCKSVECNTSNGSVDITQCIEACEKYKNYVSSKKNEYEIQKYIYDAQFKKNIGNDKDAPYYLKEKCKDNKCNCLHEKFNSEDNWKKPYETLEDTLKGKCMCKPPPPASNNTTDILEKTIPFGVALALGSIAFLFLK
ncbi:hypothetical protein PFMALIP_05818, partial [Plasmodium falciparum MaliPS096_E11]